MKVAVVLLALVMAVSASPVAKAVDWAAVAAKAAEVHGIVAATLEEIIKIAKDDNLDVGTVIEGIIDEHRPEALEILAEANAAIENQTLTEDQARDIFGRLEDKLAEVRAALADSVADLSAQAAAQISAKLEAALVTGEQLANEIYALLRE